jgi:hypothetical protein
MCCVSATPEHDTPAEIDVPAELLADLNAPPLISIFAEECRSRFVGVASEALSGITDRLCAREGKLDRSGPELAAFLAAEALWGATRVTISPLAERLFPDSAATVIGRVENLFRSEYAAVVRVAIGGVVAGNRYDALVTAVGAANERSTWVRAGARLIAGGVGSPEPGTG